MGCLGATSHICACRIPISNREYDTYRKTVKVPKGADDVQTAPSKGRAWRAKVKIARKTSGRHSPKRPVKRPKAKRPIRPKAKRTVARSKPAIRKTPARRAKASKAKAPKIVVRAKKRLAAPAATSRPTAPRATERQRTTPARLDRARRTLEETIQTPPLVARPEPSRLSRANRARRNGGEACRITRR